MRAVAVDPKHWRTGLAVCLTRPVALGQITTVFTRFSPAFRIGTLAKVNNTCTKTKKKYK